MLDWIFEGVVNWIAAIASQVMDAIAGLFLDALGTDLTTMEEYFPFLEKAYEVMQYTAWAMLFLITVWQLFRVFGGPISEAESPWLLVVRSSIFAVLIGYAKPIFEIILDIARAPYTALMDLEMTGEDFTFAGIEESLKNGILTIAGIASIVGTLLLIILLIALGWNYFRLLLETVERYIVVGVLCYTSPVAYCMGGSKVTNPVFKSWCRMVGSQLLLLVMNVWFLRAFNSSVGQFIATGGTLTTGKGSIFLWTFCALAFLKTAQRFDSYLAAMGLNVAQTGSSMGFELLMAARVISGIGSGVRSAGSVFKSGSAATAGAAGGVAPGFASKFRGNSYVRDAVVHGGVPMGAGGGIGFVGRTFGGIAARNGATLNADSISSVASRMPGASGSIGGDIANRSLSHYMPQLSGYRLSGTQVSGGRISTTATGSNGLETAVEMYSSSQYERPSSPHSVVSAADGSQWYQMAYGQNAGAFFDAPHFTGSLAETGQVTASFPSVPEGTTMRTAADGVMEVNTVDGNAMWYSSAYYNEPDAPHETVQAANGVEWYAMQSQAEIPEFEAGSEALLYNQTQFAEFIPGYEGQQIADVDGSAGVDGKIEVRHEDGSGTMFYDSAQYNVPRGDYKIYEDVNGHGWYAIAGEPAVVRRPIFEGGEPVYNGDNVQTITVETIRYDSTPSRFNEPSVRDNMDFIPPRRK